MKSIHLLKNQLPILDEIEWELIFEFLDCFILENNESIEFNWNKVRNILLLQKKIKQD